MILEENSICKEPMFQRVFHTQSESVRNFILYKGGNPEQAEDITQEAFIKLWKYCAKVPYNKAKSFLFKVAQNTFYNQKEHEKVVLKFKQKAPLSTKDHIDPAFLLEEKEFMARLKKSIAELPENQRVVFLMNRMDKKTYREIAEIIGISQKGVERRMGLALKTLRSKIGKI
jgi:RNA polymerase sigma-70 factor (ECF subfamily)